MSYRLHRKSRPQADVEIFGGPLHQTQFDGGMNIDSPASEIGANEVAYAENVIFRKSGSAAAVAAAAGVPAQSGSRSYIEARPGTVKYSTAEFAGLTQGNVNSYCYNPASYTGTYQNYRHTLNYNGQIRSYQDNPRAAYLASSAMAQVGGLASGVDYAAGGGDTTMLPFRRGWLTCTASKLSYTDPLGSFQINAANPVHGVANAGSGTFKYRYLLTLSRILAFTTDPTSATVAADRLAPNAEVICESGTNGKAYYNGSVSTARDLDYGEVLKATAIAVGDGYAIPNGSLVPAFATAIAPTVDSGAAPHFTHVSIYRCEDAGAAGIAAGNNSAIFVWVADVKKADAASGFTDTITDDVLSNRIASQNMILKTQGFIPMPSGSCAEIASGWLFISDRSNATPENYLHYCATSSLENIGYYFGDIQKYKYNDGIRALRANGDILSVFCNNSSHIVNLTAVNSDASKLQYIPFLTYFQTIDRTLGIKDWGTLDSIDQNTMIAVCSDGSVRMWDTTKWGDDLAFEKVSKEIKKIVPASATTYARGSVGKFSNGAYYLWYSIDSSDTHTTKCLRYGFGKQAGSGWCFYTGWVYPPFKCGAQVIVDSLGVQRLIVLDSANSCQFVWVETFKPYTGALDFWRETIPASSQLDRFDTDLATYGAAGTAIASTWKFRDLIGADEADCLIHDETFHRWRPRDESVGYLAGLAISMSGYKDGSATAAETVTNQPKTASVKFTSEIAARRVQLGVSTNVGGWRYVGIDTHMRSLDRQNFATAGDNSSSESTTAYPQYQAELATSLNHWVTRREVGRDCATGTLLTVAGTITTTPGPDGVLDSGYLFSNDNAAYTESSANTYASDFCASFWIRTVPTNLNLFSIAGTSPMSCKFTSATVLSFSGLGTVTVASVAVGWHHFAIIRSGTTISVYQNGVLKGIITDSGPTSLGGGNITLGCLTGIIQIFDFRIFSVVKTLAAIAYYYNDVINNAGALMLPQV